MSQKRGRKEEEAEIEEGKEGGEEEETEEKEVEEEKQETHKGYDRQCSPESLNTIPEPLCVEDVTPEAWGGETLSMFT